MAPAPRAGLADLYAELEVEKDADAATIKKSYRKLVLKYHPDKNPDNAEAAEEKIRRINNAYETLSNPAKRMVYDNQARSMETKARGMRVDTSMIKPRMSIPKAFMLHPMGHPDRFLRAIGRGLAFHCRADLPEVEFDAFFQAARFSLWWLPLVNNMCRLRTQPLGVSTGIVGAKQARLAQQASSGPSGQILSFGLGPGDSQSDVMLSDNEQPQCTNVIAVASPDYPGAYRFEAAYCPGHYLSFDPPKHAQMMRGGDQFAVIDFVLTDFLVSENFKTIDEVLIPAVEALGGGKEGVSLTRVCQNSGVVHHFQKTMGGVIWDFEDFRLHFHAHSDIWDYDPTSQSLRLRGPQEKLAQSLRRARAAAEVASLMSAARQQPAWLPLDAAARALRLLRQGAGAPKAAAGAEALRKAAEAEAKLLRVVCSMCRAGDEHVSLGGLCDAWRALSSGTDGSQADPEAAQLRAEALEAVVKCASEQVVEEQVSFDIPILGALVAMPLDWERCAQVALEKARQVISSEPIARLVPLLREFAGARARKLCDCLATAAIMKVFAAEPAVAIDALDAMVSGGFGLEGAPMVLEMLLGKVPWTASAPVIAGLAEHGAAGDDLDKCWGAVLEPSALETLPGPLLARLALAAAGRRGAGAAGAAGARLQAVALPLAARLRDVPLPLAADVAVCAAGSGPECAGLLEAAVARVAAEGSEPPPADLLRVTQALLPLGDLGTAPRDAAVRCWRRRLEAGAAAAREARAKAQELRVGDAIEVFGLTSETGRPLNGRSGSVTRPIPEKGRFEVRLSLGFSAAETVSLNPKNLRKVRAGTGVAGPTPAELPLGLSADELSRVLAAVAPAAAQSGDGGRALLELLAEEILEQQSGLTAAGGAALEGALGGGGTCPDFAARARLEAAAGGARRSGSRSVSRSRTPPRSRP